jgi:hypothetical protein
MYITCEVGLYVYNMHNILEKHFSISLHPCEVVRVASEHIKRAGHNPRRGPSEDWKLVTTANEAIIANTIALEEETNSFMCFLKNGEA